MRNVSAGVAMRFWSPVSLPAGRIPGTTSVADGPAESADRCYFLRRAHEAAQSLVESHAGKQFHFVRRVAFQADGAHLAGIHAGQHGDGEKFGRIGHAIECRARGRQHRRASGGMNGQHVRAQACGRSNRAGHGVGNVVELQVEEDGVPAREDRLQHSRVPLPRIVPARP